MKRNGNYLTMNLADNMFFMVSADKQHGLLKSLLNTLRRQPKIQTLKSTNQYGLEMKCRLNYNYKKLNIKIPTILKRKGFETKKQKQLYFVNFENKNKLQQQKSTITTTTTTTQKPAAFSTDLKNKQQSKNQNN